MLETLDYTIRIGSTPTFLYFDLYLLKERLVWKMASEKRVVLADEVIG